MHLTTKVSRPLAAPQIINDSSYPIVQGISDSVTASGKRPNSHEIQQVTESDKATVLHMIGHWELAKQSLRAISQIIR